MVFYFSLFLSFLYFKIARVYYKEEKTNFYMWLQHSLVAVSVLALLVYGFVNLSWYIVLIVAFLFFIFAALVVSAIQVGVFIDGKPFVKLSHLYKALAFMGMFIAFGSVYLWGL
jgi:signal transduction histidine kinase